MTGRDTAVVSVSLIASSATLLAASCTLLALLAPRRHKQHVFARGMVCRSGARSPDEGTAGRWPPPGTSAIAFRFLLSAFALIHVLAAAFVALLAAAAPLLGAAALLLAATALLCAAALLALLAALIALVRAALALIVPSTLILIRHGVLL
jgi:hypothetical protein